MNLQSCTKYSKLDNKKLMLVTLQRQLTSGCDILLNFSYVCDSAVSPRITRCCVHIFPLLERILMILTLLRGNRLYSLTNRVQFSFSITIIENTIHVNFEILKLRKQIHLGVAVSHWGAIDV